MFLDGARSETLAVLEQSPGGHHPAFFFLLFIHNLKAVVDVGAEPGDLSQLFWSVINCYHLSSLVLPLCPDRPES